MRCDSPSVEKANSDKDKLLAALVNIDFMLRAAFVMLGRGYFMVFYGII